MDKASKIKDRIINPIIKLEDANRLDFSVSSLSVYHLLAYVCDVVVVFSGEKYKLLKFLKVRRPLLQPKMIPEKRCIIVISEEKQIQVHCNINYVYLLCLSKIILKKTNLNSSCFYFLFCHNQENVSRQVEFIQILTTNFNFTLLPFELLIMVFSSLQNENC